MCSQCHGKFKGKPEAGDNQACPDVIDVYYQEARMMRFATRVCSANNCGKCDYTEDAVLADAAVHFRRRRRATECRDLNWFIEMAMNDPGLLFVFVRCCCTYVHTPFCFSRQPEPGLMSCRRMTYRNVLVMMCLAALFGLTL